MIKFLGICDTDPESLHQADGVMLPNKKRAEVLHPEMANGLL
jgi:hypothetical protein